MKEIFRLTSKRAVNNQSESQHLLAHAPSRHRDLGQDVQLLHPDGRNFGQGTLFPRYITTAHITEMENIVQNAWEKWRKGYPSKIHACQSASDAYRVMVRLGKYGIKYIGAFIRDNQVATVFPEEATNASYLTTKGKKATKL